MTTETSIDSIKLLIPYKVERLKSREREIIKNPIKQIPVWILDLRLSSSVFEVYSVTGEQGRTRNNIPLSETVNGIANGYSLYTTNVGPSQVTFISVALTSKMLKQDYLKGMTSENIRKVYDFIIEDKIIFIEYEDFLKCRIQHADIKRDREVKDVTTSLKRIKKALLTSVKAKPWRDNKLLTGYTIGQRDSKEIYIKFYNKGNELLTKSNEFNLHHLHRNNIKCPDQLLRTEITLDNRRLKQYFPEYSETLQSFINEVELHGNKVIDAILLKGNYFRTEKRVPSFFDITHQSKFDLRLSIRIQEAVRVYTLPGQQLDLKEMEESLLTVIDCGINRKSLVLKLIRYHFENRSQEDEIIHPEVLTALRIKLQPGETECLTQTS